MANDIKITEEGKPLTEELSGITVGGERSSLYIGRYENGAKVIGDLEVTGVIRGNLNNLESSGQLKVDTDGKASVEAGSDGIALNSVDGGSISLNSDGNVSVESDEGVVMNLTSGTQSLAVQSAGTTTTEIDNGASGTTHVKLMSLADTGDYSKLSTTANGATTLATVDDDGNDDAHLTLDADGDIAIDSATGEFIMKKAGTEFSVANSAYAGMILGYRCIGEDATPVTYTLTTSMTVIHSDANVSFIVPPSGNVEINFQVHYFGGNGATVSFGISTADSYSALSGPSSQYDKVSFDVARFDDAIINQNWVITGLTPGASTQYWIGAKTSSTSGTPTLKYGGDSQGENVPLIIKVTALPSATTDYAVYG